MMYFVFSLCTAIALLFSSATWAQPAWPQRALTLVVPFGAGGIADVTARTVAEAMSQSLRQAVVVDNRPGAGSIVATQMVAKAKPDGYTLLLMTNGHAVSTHLFKNVSYSTTDDFQQVSTLGFFDLGLFTTPKKPWKSLTQFLEAARKQPGQLAIGTIAAGSTQHLATMLFRSTAGVDVLVVPYKTSPALHSGLLSGEIDAAMDVVGPMLGHVSAGTAVALATTGGQRNAALPNVPTVQESGVANYNVASWNGIAVPKGTPAAIVEQLQQTIASVMAQPGVQQRLASTAMRAEASTPQAAQALLVKEIERWGEVIRSNGIALE